MFWLLVFFGCVIQHVSPETKSVMYHWKSFRRMISDSQGIKLSDFPGEIDEEFEDKKAGAFPRNIIDPKNDRWKFTGKITKLEQIDVIYYWNVDSSDGYKKLGYKKDEQQYVVNDFAPNLPQIDVKSPTLCEATFTISTIPNICRGQVIFQDDFSANTLRSSFWTPEQRYADAPDYEFVMYMDHPETLQVKDGKVIIKPLLSDEVFGNDFLTSKQGYNFGENCTSIAESQLCSRRYDGFYLPPVVSAQLTTRNKFAFKYGRIEIRAKLPKGDWIYPELYLNPYNEIYGPHLESGQIRVAFAAGNLKENHILHGGIILGSTPSARTYGDRTTERRNYWSDDFHTFTINWKPTGITVGVDNVSYGTIYPPPNGFADLGSFLEINTENWKSGSTMAPFDQEMYITIGLGVGGETFEDKTVGTKPWRRKQRYMVKQFYKAKNHWKNTWSGNSVLEVEHVKVTAV